MADGAGLRKITPLRYRTLVADMPVLRELLGRAPQEGSLAARQSPLVLSLPWPDGSERRFRVEESSILAPELAAKFPELHTYIGQGVDDGSATARLDLTPLGFHAQVLSTEGAVYIDPYRTGDVLHYQSYWKRDLRQREGAPWHCDFDKVNPEAASEPVSGPAPETPRAPSGGTLRTYRLAVAATGEYTTAVCAPNPAGVACGLAAILVSVNRVVGVYEHDLAIRMTLVANNNLIVYTNGATDPYTNGNGSTMLGQNQTNLNSVIGSANYDIGHVFSTGGGGVAFLGVPCTSNKARGVTGSSSPVGDGFDIDYVAHEMGHQFGGDHTFNGQTGSCGGSNRTATSAYEPGSGSTIMAYAGICGAEDLQPHSDPYFHVRSFDQIVAFSTGTACDVETATGNTIPTVDAGASFTIPRQTPFTLTALNPVDPDGDTLSYNWEEFDLGAAAPPNDDVAAVRPIFRSFNAAPSLARTFPRLSDILSNTSTLGESLPTRNRTMTFRVTVRDNRANGGGVDYDSTTVVVNAASGPFLVTDPNTAITWAGGSTANVAWNVAGTTAAPVSCANVEIRLSTDGGLSFPTVLSASTPNDGAQSVSVPLIATTTARVRVGCVGNIFFDLSNANFAIGLPTNTPTTTPTSTRTGTPTSTRTATQTPVQPLTATATATSTLTRTLTPAFTATPTATATLTRTATATATSTLTPAFTATPTATATPTRTATATATSTLTRTLTPTLTRTSTAPPTATQTLTQTQTAGATATSTATRTLTPTLTRTSTAPPTATATQTPTVTSTETATTTATATEAATGTPTETRTSTPILTETATQTATGPPAPTHTMTEAPSPEAVASPSATGTPVPAASATPTATPPPQELSSPGLGLLPPILLILGAGLLLEHARRRGRAFYR